MATKRLLDLDLSIRHTQGIGITDRANSRRQRVDAPGQGLVGVPHAKWGKPE